jgi:glycosyltransferase involved in cell wall biosynthesis
MKKLDLPRPITIFTPSFADHDITNAQALTVKEIVVRLPEDEFRVVMICRRTPDPRIKHRKNTKLLPYHKHGNALTLLAGCLLSRPDVYFYPMFGPLDAAVLTLRRKLHLRLSVVSPVLMEMTEVTGVGLAARSILEANAVFAVSDYVAKTVQKQFGIKVGTISDGITRRHFFCEDSNREHGDSLTVLYAGSFQPRKRVDLVIREASRRPDVNFRLAGRGETETACNELAERLGCRNVTFLGPLPQAELGQEMRNAHVFLFPSILEGHPQVLGQAAACGLPAIAMDLYHPDYVIHGQTGFLVNSDEELSQRLNQLLRDSKLRRSMAAAAVLHSAKFDWDRSAEQWAQSFRDVVSRRKNR